MPELINTTRSLDIFSEHPALNIDMLLKVCKRKTFRKGDILVSKDALPCFVFIHKGSAKIVKKNSDGLEIAFSVLKGRDHFGLNSIISGVRYSVYVIALEDSEVYQIDRDTFLSRLRDNPDTSMQLIQSFYQRLYSLETRLQPFLTKKTDKRIAVIIFNYAFEKGKVKHGLLEIDKLPAQKEIALRAGTARETVSRTLHSFENMGFLRLEGSRLTILNFEDFKNFTFNNK